MFSTVSRFSNLLNVKTAAVLAACTVYSVIVAHPASAQQFSPEEFTPAPQTAFTPAPQPAYTKQYTQEVSPAQMHPGVRYTTGYTTTRGWETNLVKGDANLGHWNWSPMVSYNQSSPSRPTGRQASSAPQSVQSVSHYVKPIHAAMPLSELQISEMKAARSCSARLTHENVSAKLRTSPRAGGDLYGKLMNPPMLSYGSDYGRANGSGSVARADVYGVIRSH